MTYVPVKGFQIFNDRHGKARCYHRTTRTKVDLEKYPIGSAGFFAECARISALADKGVDAKPGTLGLLIKRYKEHLAFTDLAPRTREDYQRCFDYLQPIADTPLSCFSPPLVVKIRDKAAGKMGRKWGNYIKIVLSVVFGWGVERGYLKTNPAFKIRGIRRPKGAPQANRPWTDAERHAVLEALPAHMVVPISLMMYCGLDPQDALQLPRTAIANGMIDTRRGKTGEAVWLPLPAPVTEELVAAPEHEAITLCANSRGRPWTVSGFRASWRPIRIQLEEAGLVASGLTLKGLRHTVATVLAEMGFDDRTIADVLSQKTEAMARHYSRRANKTRKLTGVVKDFEAELNRRRTK